MSPVNIQKITKEVQASSNSALCAPPQDKSSLIQAAKDRYKDIKKREKKHQKHKMPRNNEEKQETTEAAPPFSPALRSSRSISEFRYLNKIDEGAFAVVHRARDKRTGEVVALKQLKPVNKNEGFSVAAWRELKILMKMQHPNIVAGRDIAVNSRNNDVFIVMQFIDYDLKIFLGTMHSSRQIFTPEHVKSLVTQLLSAVHHLHDKNILHRDLKTRNILLSDEGVLKVADFGLAREYELAPRQYSPGVGTRWYRAPEILLLSKQYSTPVDMWSVGCIMAEIINLEPLFPGTSELDQINRIFKVLGTPSNKNWPGYSALPMVRNIIFDHHPPGGLRHRMKSNLLTESGLSLLHGLLTYDPTRRMTAAAALQHPYFKELPVAIEPAKFLAWPPLDADTGEPLVLTSSSTVTASEDDSVIEE